MVYFCYIDESGTSQIPGNTSHYILSGLSIPVCYWKKCDKEISAIKKKYRLKDAEIHTAWILRKYLFQFQIPGFDAMDYIQRRQEMDKLRKQELFRLQKSRNPQAYIQTKKTYKHTEAYIHLTYQERIKLIQELADKIGGWKFARIFAECVDKVFFDPSRTKQTIDEQALEQIVSRYEQYLANVSAGRSEDTFGVLIHDNNETVSKKHTELMKRFHVRGTLWTNINHIIETPLFVNSELTSLVQIADLCSYALRRYFENNEIDLISRFESRFDRKNSKIVGVRHFTDPSCQCMICKHNT